MGRLAKVMGGQCQPGLKAYKTGGAVHGDEAQDKVLIKRMIRAESKAEKGVNVKKAKKGGKRG